MFIYKQLSKSGIKDISQRIEKEFGIMPIHWELLASISPKRFEMFMDEIRYILNHKNIDRDFFSMLRLYIANREGFSYCKSFNTKLLLARGYSKSDLKLLKENISKIPLNYRHRLLASKVIKAIYTPNEFLKTDIDELRDNLWSDSDIYDAIDHGAFLFKFSKILRAYSL